MDKMVERFFEEGVLGTIKLIVSVLATHKFS